ncbi:hypothetical protein HER18_08150 [Chryseobacterium sp. NEB161]|nr:hypothetical protein HER18_08150 [Chryseobacterium sp. NEB161]
MDYYRGAYGENITSFRKAIPVLQRYDDFAWLAVVYSFMAKDLLETGSKGQALRYALKVDSVFNKNSSYCRSCAAFMISSSGMRYSRKRCWHNYIMPGSS